jgi:hypothetical protein
MQLATVGTTKRLETFSPASSGSVHSLVTASRAEFAWMEARPGRPAVQRDEHVEALGLADLADDDAARAACAGPP